MKVTSSEIAFPAGAAANILKALAQRHRLAIVCQLLAGERSVGELAGMLGLRDSNVSQHLALLRRNGVVRARRERQTVRYGIASLEARQIVETLHMLYCAPDPAQPC
ncbi:ArsR/SmtB family transcription factor [Futiania mangrovi]|uniref:Metalloregulator ArsR/SmtB family transcription factor n=1 Tax=Futiania mangrovi TaxID=2959716 RepID=A0A9J6PDK4_9PROT|nr:metalloregulator ArsR/SmtB family transcription factor [Futiania mangrovii]MCP1336721.1 metalloregulator ArsR/SmtB family transcription factor [Futiania mangrovii]